MGELPVDLRVTGCDITPGSDGCHSMKSYGCMIRKKEGTDLYLVQFSIPSGIKLGDENKPEKGNPDQTFTDEQICDFELNVYVTYSNNLAKETLQTSLSSITVKPVKSEFMKQMDRQIKEARETWNNIKKWIKRILWFGGFCAAAGGFEGLRKGIESGFGFKKAKQSGFPPCIQTSRARFDEENPDRKTPLYG
ncbi:MAG: hypothetical protein DRP11_02565 [Candidatus Aenigmatarchaeota archaeon]|nr:MAG: hypothetical protein DRP11_02565 [Candidatus Aenigmarchaeota archaeon]